MRGPGHTSGASLSNPFWQHFRDNQIYANHQKYSPTFWLVTHKATDHQGALRTASGSPGGGAEASDDVNVYIQSNGKTNSCMSFTSPASPSVFIDGWSLKVVAAHCIIICLERQHADTTDGRFLRAMELSWSHRRSNISDQLIMLVWLSRGQQTHLCGDQCHHYSALCYS